VPSSKIFTENFWRNDNDSIRAHKVLFYYDMQIVVKVLQR